MFENMWHGKLKVEQQQVWKPVGFIVLAFVLNCLCSRDQSPRLFQFYDAWGIFSAEMLVRIFIYSAAYLKSLCKLKFISIKLFC